MDETAAIYMYRHPIVVFWPPVFDGVGLISSGFAITCFSATSKVIQSSSGFDRSSTKITDRLLTTEEVVISHSKPMTSLICPVINQGLQDSNRFGAPPSMQGHRLHTLTPTMGPWHTLLFWLQLGVWKMPPM